MACNKPKLLASFDCNVELGVTAFCEYLILIFPYLLHNPDLSISTRKSRNNTRLTQYSEGVEEITGLL